LLYSQPMHDCLTGMVIFRRSQFQNRVFKEGGWDFCLELKLVAVVDPKIRFAEVHVPYHDRVLDQSKQRIFATGFGHLWYLFRFRMSPKY